MRLTYALGETEHWVEVRDDIVWTRKRLKELADARIQEAADALRQIDDVVTGCRVTDVDGHEYTDWQDITTEVLDNVHPAVLEFLAWLPWRARDAQATLGNVIGGR